MAIPLTGLCGPTYALENEYAAVERCFDRYPIANESQEETKFKMALAQCPGNMKFGQLPVPGPYNVPCRGIQPTVFGLYGVSGAILWQMGASGIYSTVHVLTNSAGFTNPVSFGVNGNGQLGIADNGFFYVVEMETNTFTAVSSANYIAGGKCAFQDGYVLAVNNAATLIGGANFFQISGTDATPVGDMRLWDPANISIQEGQSDPLQDLISAREYIRFLGSLRSQAYYNAGANGLGGFPFQSYNETFIETGTAATWASDDLGDSLVWIGQDKRGTACAWRDFGFQPQRISNFAVEQFWQAYGDISDAISFTYKWKGHIKWQVTFPSANDGVGATWVYDATVSQVVGRPTWHERTFRLWSSTGIGAPVARPERFHAFCFGKHLVASVGTDGNPGAIYQYADVFADCGVSGTGGQVMNAQVPVRVLPHIYDSLNRIIVNRIRVDGKRPQVLRLSRTGTTPDPASQVYAMQQNAQDPQMSYSGRLGYARDWVFSFSGDGTANDNGLVDGSIDLTECSS